MSMWRPPERIRHQPVAGPWPSAERAARSRLFSPIQLGPLALEQRTWVPAMVPWRATDDGFVSPNVLAWYERFARGRPGAIVIEATGIRDVPSGPLLRLGDDRFLAGIRELVEVVRKASDGHTKLLIQLIDFLAMRRRPERAKYFERLLRITPAHREALQMSSESESEVRARLAALDDETLRSVLSARELESLERGYRERVTDVELDHIAKLPETLPTLFAEAATRAEKAGLDGVELHYAHAYTMASFLSATNDRQDGYGGSREARVRLPLEVYSSVRAAVSKNFAVGCRFLAQECIDGGSSIDDAVWYATEFASAGMDFISVSRGGKFDDAKQPKVGEAAYPYTGPSGYECMPSYYSDATGPFGRNLVPSKRIRESIRAAGQVTPLVTAGGIHNFQQAEEVLVSEQADVVGFARQALADPDWFSKVLRGQGADVRLCMYTNYCEALDQRHREVTCELWDRQDLDQPGVARSADGKRRLIAPD
ncbi:NADH:flavin oxidoreductase [Steroidobacter sp.]|uniref:NADH:flavin oxidoreductase n=1 Tax=Steroidobacter sp. TaxID=1978227 RepID=UPI001A3A4978|nr:NADH:flavin oxidoreductase [Steroidobacter sp.]MBL8265216.1 NADH:flavin oxidoreductase [Steroidobacter sp.]